MGYKGEVPSYVSIPDYLIPLFGDLLQANVEHLDTDLAWVLIFVKTKKELKEQIDKVLPLISGDVPVWFAYPKKSSKRFKSDISRDSGWERLGDHNMEPVRQIAIDEDWSALRFRKLEFIKTLSRRKSMRLTK